MSDWPFFHEDMMPRCAVSYLEIGDYIAVKEDSTVFKCYVLAVRAIPMGLELRVRGEEETQPTYISSYHSHPVELA